MTVEIMHMSFYKIVMQVQIDVLSVVSNVQQVPPEELIASQDKTESSSRFALTVAMCVFLYQCRYIYVCCSEFIVHTFIYTLLTFKKFHDYGCVYVLSLSNT